MKFLSFVIFALAFISPAISDLQGPTYPQNVGNWTGWGGNTYNNRWAITNSYFNSTSVSNLIQHCQIKFKMGISATPTISGDFTYFPTWGGLLVAVNYKTCDIAWETNVTEIVYNWGAPTELQTYSQSTNSRTSPQVDGDVLYFGTQCHALLVALDISTGEYLNAIQINDHAVAQISMSPTFYEGVIYVGSSSEEEMAITYPDGLGTGYTCCDFVGNFGAYKFDHSTKNWTQLWNVDSIGDSKNNGFAGAGMWGSQPPVDSIRNQVFFATGNLYSYPDSYRDCTTTACMPSDVYQESVFAADLATGNINWVRQISALDAWTFACTPPYNVTENNVLCPYGPGEDADFAMAPTFVPSSLGNGVYENDTILIGQKSGTLYSMSATDGSQHWGTLTGPSGDEGGLAWGIAVDDELAYFNAINYGNVTWALPNGVEITNGAFGALNQKTGKIIWETQIPDLQVSTVSPTVVGDIMVTGSTGAENGYVPGSLIVLNKSTGDILVNVELDSIFHGGIAFANQYMILGTGYSYDIPQDRVVFGFTRFLRAFW